MIGKLQRRARLAALALPVAAALVLSACSSNQPATATGTAGDGAAAFKVGLLLPDLTAPRYETKDRPYFEKRLKELCADCTVLYANANLDAAAQQQQAQSMLTQGIKVLVVDPVDGVAAASIVGAAKSRNIPVVAYDRLIHSPDLSYVISNDYEKVGQLQATALVERLKELKVTPEQGGILMMNGSPTDNNALSMKKGATPVIEASGFKVLSHIDTWDPDEAQKWAAGQITRFGKKIVGVYSANDGNAGGAIASFHAANISPVPPLTGLDASIEGLQAILAGDQYMTVYNAFQKEAFSAAEVTFELASGKTPQSSVQVDGHPATLNDPASVTIDTIVSTVIKDELYKVSEICTPEYAEACAKAGIK